MPGPLAPPARLRSLLSVGVLAVIGPVVGSVVGPVLAAELPVPGSFRDAQSCEAVQALASGASRTDGPLSDDERQLLSDAVESGVTMDASRVAGPGGWACTFPQVWTVREGERWLAVAACDGNGDFFPAILTLERLEEARFRLRLGDGADAVNMVPCELVPTEGAAPALPGPAADTAPGEAETDDAAPEEEAPQ